MHGFSLEMVYMTQHLNLVRNSGVNFSISPTEVIEIFYQFQENQQRHHHERGPED